MNEKETTEYLEKLKNIMLAPDARETMQAHLSEYADFHKAPGGVRVGGTVRSIERVPEGTFITRLKALKLTYMTALILIVLMIGGGTSYAAQGSVPGDVLYPIKVEVNENIESAFAFSHSQEAQLQADLLAERLKEAETLHAKGELNATVSADLKSRIEEHFKEAVNENTKAEADGDVETAVAVRASLKATLATYAEIFARVDSEAGTKGSVITDIKNFTSVKAESEATSSTRVDGILNIDEAVNGKTDVKLDSGNVTTEKTDTDSEGSIDAGVQIDTDVDTQILDVTTQTKVDAQGVLGH